MSEIQFDKVLYCVKKRIPLPLGQHTLSLNIQAAAINRFVLRKNTMIMKKRILNITLALFLSATTVIAVWVLLMILNAIKTAQIGAELVTYYIVLYVVLIAYSVAVICEINLYFNLRYFIIDTNKSDLKTVLNIGIISCVIMMILSTVYAHFLYIPFLFLSIESAEILCFAFFVLMLILRLIHAIVNRSASPSSKA